MKPNHLICAAALLAALGVAPLCATVTIVSLTPSAAPPQPVGTTVTFSVKATDSNANDLTFQFNVAPPNGTLMMVKDFNIGTLSA